MGEDLFPKLSPRQRDCLRLVAELKDSQQIGHELGISPRTVDGYLSDAVQLLGAHNRRHAATLLREHEAKAPPEKLPEHFPRLEDQERGLETLKAQSSDGVSGEPKINSVGDVRRPYSDGEPVLIRQRLSIFGGERRPGDIGPAARLALILATSLVSGLGFFILALAAVGLIALAGYLRP